jgi:pyruvate/2-oxoglutarate dehydrogenase complex dihydrolipoamide dehydrogenase (E3) component
MTRSSDGSALPSLARAQAEGREPRILPDDKHNRFLLEQVHPRDWVNPEPHPLYDLVVVGGGSGGLVSSAIGAGVGARVALVERHLLGGDCLNTGCVPSKAVIRSARAWHEAREAESRFGAGPISGEGDFGAAMRRMRALRARISRHDSASRFSELGIHVFLGQGRFTGTDRLEVDGATLHFRRAVIATGGRPTIPPIPGLEEAGFLTSETVFQLTRRPHRLAVIGGGPIGCELAQAMARLGSQVTVVEMEDRILPRDDPEASGLVTEAMERDGVVLRTGVRVAQVDVEGDERVLRLLTLATGSGSEGAEDAGGVAEIRCDQILVATGRRPNVEGLGLEEAGVEVGRDGIRVDRRLRSTNRRIYAVGDVTGGPQFTHRADAHARLAVPNALFFGRGRTDRLVIPWCTYTSPEVAHVGLPPGEAERRPKEVATVTVRFDEVDRRLLEGEEEGFLKVYLRPGSDTILGATAAGEHAGELLTPILVAMKGGVGLDAISGTVFPYPTRGEVIRKAADRWRKRKLTPRVQRWMERVLRLLR